MAPVLVAGVPVPAFRIHGYRRKRSGGIAMGAIEGYDIPYYEPDDEERERLEELENARLLEEEQAWKDRE